MRLLLPPFRGDLLGARWDEVVQGKCGDACGSSDPTDLCDRGVRAGCECVSQGLRQAESHDRVDLSYLVNENVRTSGQRHDIRRDTGVSRKDYLAPVGIDPVRERIGHMRHDGPADPDVGCLVKYERLDKWNSGTPFRRFSHL